jgi:4-hydroxy-tetrahydrodipicolinate synthase
MNQPSVQAELWPTMLTPYRENGEVDFDALGELVEWYLANGATGLFAVCQSSEMFFLSLEERKQIAAFVHKKAAGRVPVIASGHISDSFEDQVRELTEIASAGVDAVVLVPNRLAPENTPDSVFLERLEKLTEALPKDVPLGIYECPYPYKKLMTPGLIRFCAQSGRFRFLKDTSCDLGNMAWKLRLMRGTPMKLYNANSTTLLGSLKDGAAGYSGVMANMQLRLYSMLCRHAAEDTPQAAELAKFLSFSSLIERQCYPVNAKYSLQLEGVPLTLYSRARNREELSETYRMEVRNLRDLSAQMEEKFRACGL